MPVTIYGSKALVRDRRVRVDSGPRSYSEATHRSGGDVAYGVELRASIERGLADCESGRVIAVEDLMKELGVEESRSSTVKNGSVSRCAYRCG